MSSDKETDDESSGGSWVAAAGVGALMGGGLVYLFNKWTTEDPTCNGAPRCSSNSLSTGSESYLNRPVTTEECSICKDNVLLVVRLPCGHRFHDACVKLWIQKNKTCPTCRRPTELTEMKYSV